MAPLGAAFACDDAQRPPEARLRKLTSTQYQNTLLDVIAGALGDAMQATQVMTQLQGVLSHLPADQREPLPQDLHGSYRRLDQTMQQSHVDAFLAIGTAAGALLTSGESLARTAGACATDDDPSNDTACVTQFIQRFGRQALRRPLTAEEVTFYHSVYGASDAPDAAAYADVIAVFLNSPQFLYFTEHGEQEVEHKGGVYRLSAHELASRLSYQLWQTAPDDELSARADSGELLDAAVFAEQVDRLDRDPRASRSLDEFIADWLKVENLPALDANVHDATFRTFAGDDLPNPELRAHMIDDVTSMAKFYLRDRPGTLADLLQSQLSFAKYNDVAKLYGGPVWDGSTTPPTFASQERPGIFTRALFLSTGTANTRPIQKGVFLRRQILCDEIPPPPANANAIPPDLRPDMTTREVVEELTQKPGTACMGCHGVAINGLGFATEGFDSLGRSRTAQTLFDASGAVVGHKPVDTRSVPRVESSDETPSRGPADVMNLVEKSGKAEACLSRNYFRFTYARWEDEAIDGCALERARQAVSVGKVPDLFRATVLAPEFAQRAFQ